MRQYLRSLSGPDRKRSADIQLGITLAFIAGAINAGGFLAVGAYTSHMTGVVSSIADHLALKDFTLAGYALAYVISFLGGAATTAVLINWARARAMDGLYALPLMLEALLLLFFGFTSSGDFNHSPPAALHLTIMLLCFIMGLQNAIITKISRAEIRTTHMTGIVTDLGIEAGRFIYGHASGDATVHADAPKLRLLSGLLAAFLTGGVTGALLFIWLGAWATLPFALLLGLLAILPLADDWRK